MGHGHPLPCNNAANDTCVSEGRRSIPLCNRRFRNMSCRVSRLLVNGHSDSEYDGSQSNSGDGKPGTTEQRGVCRPRPSAGRVCEEERRV